MQTQIKNHLNYNNSDDEIETDKSLAYFLETFF